MTLSDEMDGYAKRFSMVVESDASQRAISRFPRRAADEIRNDHHPKTAKALGIEVSPIASHCRQPKSVGYTHHLAHRGALGPS